MRLALLTLFGTITLASVCFAETAELTDGRIVELNSDGTYEIIAQSAQADIKVNVLAPFLEHHAGEYNQNSMRFMPIIQNNTGKEIVGYKFSSQFLSAFGDEILVFAGESSERINSDSSSSADTFYYFDDNQFMANEPYDKLSIFKQNGTGRVETMITAIAFSDGTTWRMQVE